MSSGVRFHNMGWNQRKQYDKKDWPQSRRIFDRNGKLNIKKTLEDLNEHVGSDGIVDNVTDIYLKK